MISKKTNEAPPSKGVNSKQFKITVAKIDRAKQKKDDSGMEYAGAYQSADNWGFNRAPLKLALKIRDMEVSKQNDFLADLNTYLKWLGLFAQSDMFGAPDGVGAEHAGDDDDDGGDGPMFDEQGEPSAESPKGVFADGRAAGLRGDRSDACPWPADTDRAAGWMQGWQDGQAAKVHAEIKPTEDSTAAE